LNPSTILISFSVFQVITFLERSPHIQKKLSTFLMNIHFVHEGNGGWRHWFNDSTDPVTTKLFEKMEYLPDLESALHNVTTAYYRDYAFLGSSSLLDYIIRMNYTKKFVHCHHEKSYS
jgi:hypothetical protein